MTEEEWLTSAAPGMMLEAPVLKASFRKLRLFASACCRRLAPHFKDMQSLQMVEVSENFADGDATADELESAFDEAAEAQEAIHWGDGDAVDQASAEAVLGLREPLQMWQAFGSAHEVAVALATASVWERLNTTGRHWSDIQAERNEIEAEAVKVEFTILTALLRDIFGNPFRPVAFAPEWRTDTALGIARQMYEARDFSAMPILADALQDAGCDNADVLNHCRGDGPHVRGCWVVDLVLGKE